MTVKKEREPDKRLDEEGIKACFADGIVNEDWIWKVRNLAVDWVKGKQNQKHWAYVRLYSINCGVLKSMSVRRFAQLIVSLCPDDFPGDWAISHLHESIGKCEYTAKVDKFNEGGTDKGSYNEVVELFKQEVTARAEKPARPIPPLEKLLQDYLEGSMAIGPLLKLRRHGGDSRHETTFTISDYASEAFLKENTPSVVKAFVCDSGTVDEDKLDLYYGRYHLYDKLFVVSSQPFSTAVRARARESRIGLIRVDMKQAGNPIRPVLPRHEFSAESRQALAQMMSSPQDSTELMIIEDGGEITPSLYRTLYKNRVPVTKFRLNRPTDLSDADIERYAEYLIRTEILYYEQDLWGSTGNDHLPYCIVDPYKVAREHGITVDGERFQASSAWIGITDLEQRHVTLDEKVDFEPRTRFSMAHELGHALLHARLVSNMYRQSPVIADVLRDPDSHLSKALEREANYFAGCLLMPRNVVTAMYEVCHERYFEGKKVRPFNPNCERRTCLRYYDMIRDMAEHMGTSVDATKRRLSELGLMR